MQSKPRPATPRIGILGALQGEMEPLLALGTPITTRVDSPQLGDAPKHAPGNGRQVNMTLGVDLWEAGSIGPLLAVSGVGKVAAAHAAVALLAAGASGILVVGTGGAVSVDLEIGSLVHATTCIQADLAIREGRENQVHRPWSEAWQAMAPGSSGLVLSADCPVMRYWDRRRLRKAYSGTLLADMESAAVGAVCQRAGIPFAVLKVATDRAGTGARRAFFSNFEALGGLAAQSLVDHCWGPQGWIGGAAFPFPAGS